MDFIRFKRELEAYVVGNYDTKRVNIQVSQIGPSTAEVTLIKSGAGITFLAPPPKIDLSTPNALEDAKAIVRRLLEI